MSAEAKFGKEESSLGDPEAFEELRTYPGKWDVSAFQPTTRTGCKGSSTGTRATFESEDPSQEDESDWQPEAFPEPRTFPKKWDLSSL